MKIKILNWIRESKIERMKGEWDWVYWDSRVIVSCESRDETSIAQRTLRTFAYYFFEMKWNENPSSERKRVYFDFDC